MDQLLNYARRDSANVALMNTIDQMFRLDINQPVKSVLN